MAEIRDDDVTPVESPNKSLHIEVRPRIGHGVGLGFRLISPRTICGSDLRAVIDEVILQRGNRAGFGHVPTLEAGPSVSKRRPQSALRGRRYGSHAVHLGVA